MAEQKQPPYAPGSGEMPPAYPGAPTPSLYQGPPHSAAPPPPFPGSDMQYQYAQPPPPQYGMQPVQGGYIAGQPIAVQPMPGQVIVIPEGAFRDAPVSTVCNSCGQHVITSTHMEPGGLSWLLCFLLVLFGLWLGCCLIPFCIPACQDVRHSCPSCKKTIHIYRRI